MKNFKTCVTMSALIAAVLVTAGCSTLSSAYDSTASTISGWFGKGDKKTD